jgi:hypothetical protein
MGALDGCPEVMIAQTESTITCPQCGAKTLEAKPTDFCLFFYECSRCVTTLRPKPGDCCVFCSYGSIPCPPVQQRREHDGCCSGTNG